MNGMEKDIIRVLIENGSEEELRALEDVILGQLEAMEKLDPASGFIPNGAVEKLVEAIGWTGEREGKAYTERGRKWIFVVPAANSLGKTAAAVNIGVNLTWGPRNEWFRYPAFEKWAYPKKIWYISEQSTLKDFVCGTEASQETEVRKWCPVGRFELMKSGYDFFSKLTSDTGWQWTFKTFDMDPSKFESDKIGVAIFDEPPPEAIYNAVVARMTLGGIIIVVMTPLFTAAWVKERLVDTAGPGTEIFVLKADIEANCKEHGVRGRLSHEQIERIVSQYDEDEREARAKGEFMHLSGLVFKGLHPSKHRHDLPSTSFKDHRIFMVCDPHDAKPPFVGYFAVDRMDRAKAILEWPPTEEWGPFHKIKTWKLSTPEVVRALRDLEVEHGWDPSKITRIMDPNFGRKSQASVGVTVQQQFYREGKKISHPMRFTTRVVDDLAAGHRLIRDFLTPDADENVRLQIGMNCPNIWHALTHYARRKQSNYAAEADGPSERVEEKFKHGVDVIRYFLMYFRPPEGIKPPPEEIPEYLRLYDRPRGNFDPDDGIDFSDL